MTQIFASEKIVVSHTKQSFKAALVGLVVKNSAPFRMFSSESFGALVGETARKLQEMIITLL